MENKKGFTKKETEYLVEDIGKFIRDVCDKYYEEYSNEKSLCGLYECPKGNNEEKYKVFVNEMQSNNIKLKSLQKKKQLINTTISNYMFDFLRKDESFERFYFIRKLADAKLLDDVSYDLSMIFESSNNEIMNIDKKFGRYKLESDFDIDIRKLKNIEMEKNEKIKFNERYLLYINDRNPDNKQKRMRTLYEENERLMEELLFIDDEIENVKLDGETYVSMIKKIDKALFLESIVDHIYNVCVDMNLSGRLKRTVEKIRKEILKKIAEECMKEYLKRYPHEVKETS